MVDLIAEGRAGLTEEELSDFNDLVKRTEENNWEPVAHDEVVTKLPKAASAYDKLVRELRNQIQAQKAS